MFHIIGDCAFTKENFSIYVLMVKCHPSINSSTLTDRFQKYGQISEVRLMNESDTLEKIYFVHFVQPEAAARALLEEKMTKTFTLSPCDSLYQPDGLKFIEHLNEGLKITTSYDTDQENGLILKLNDDCVEEVCNMLSLNDGINFGITCLRFWHVFAMASRIKYKCLDSNTLADMTPFKVNLFLQIVGPQLQTLIINKNPLPRTLYDLFSSFCINVKKLKMKNALKEKEQLITLISKMQLLEELELCDVRFEDDFIGSLKSMKNLKYLSVSVYKNTPVENIAILSNLEKLSLKTYEYPFSTFYFRNVFEKLKNLFYLDLVECVGLADEDYEYLSRHLLKLKTLKLSYMGISLSCLAQLPNLKELEINNITFFTPDDCFFNFAKFNQLEQLRLRFNFCDKENYLTLAEFKKLKIFYIKLSKLNEAFFEKCSQLTDLEEICFSYCSDITDRGILLLLEKCQKLKSLKLEHCRTPKLISSAKELLKQRQRSYTVKHDSCNTPLTSLWFYKH